jgi:ubiquinone/menaquinone biosynthesis C-methylase UbiE
LGLSFDRIADRYDTTRWYPDQVMEDILSVLEKNLDPEKPIMDAGVGTGRFAKPLQDAGFTVVGVDISARMLEKARQKSAQDLFRADITALPFKDEAFGSALSIHVLHLISNWKLALREISRVTSGHLVSVAFNKMESPAEELRRFYDQTCADLGYVVRHPGMREREMPEVFEPDEEITITMHEHPIDVRNIISDYSNRTYSNQWMIPEDIHQQAIEALQERYDGVDQVIGRERISLLKWSADRIWEFAGDLAAK